MKTVQNYISNKQAIFSQHPFFKLLENLTTLEQINYFVPELTFWVMTFQDVLRINEEKITDPYIKKVARHHRAEDAGHEKWFLQDKKYMGDGKLVGDEIAWLFGKECRTTRDAAYQIVAESYNIKDEYLHVVLLLTLESTGHIFFEKVATQAKAVGEDANLKYFSSSHLEVEKAHELFETEMERQLFEKVLPEQTRREALLMIDRCYDAFSKMFDGLVVCCQKRCLENAAANGVANEKVVVGLGIN